MARQPGGIPYAPAHHPSDRDRRLLALAAVQLQPSTARACIAFDRSAELALIDDAIASDSSSDQLKRLLRTIRRGLTFINELPETDDEQVRCAESIITS